MNATITEEAIEPIQAEQEVQQPEPPRLESIMEAVCADAQFDSLKFILRSDTGHDGE